MARGGPVGEGEEKRIIEALEAGKTTREIAKEFNRGKSTISDIARRAGVDMAGRAQMKKADIARTCYAAEDRIKLIGEALNKGRELLKACDNPRDFQYLMTGFAIGIDKRRLEEGPGHGDKSGEITKLFEKMETEEASGGAAIAEETGGDNPGDDN